MWQRIDKEKGMEDLRRKKRLQKKKHYKVRISHSQVQSKGTERIREMKRMTEVYMI